MGAGMGPDHREQKETPHLVKTKYLEACQQTRKEPVVSSELPL